jgi:hypothetical protein
MAPHLPTLIINQEVVEAHSLRAGVVTTAVKRGMNLLKYCIQTDHKSLEMARVYCRDAELFVGNAAKCPRLRDGRFLLREIERAGPTLSSAVWEVTINARC